MKDSLYSQGKPNLRITFNSQQDDKRFVDALSGITYNGDGTAIGTSSNAMYKSMYFSTSHSVKCVFKYTTNAGTQWLFLKNYAYLDYIGLSIVNGALFVWSGPVSGGNAGYTFTNGKTYTVWLTHLGGTVYVYVNGVQTATSVGAAFDPGYKRMYFLGSGGATNYCTSPVDLIEVYPTKTISVTEIVNDYNNSTFKDIRNGIMLDLDCRNGVIEDTIGNTLSYIALTNTAPIIKNSKGIKRAYYYEPSGYPIISDADKWSFGNGTTDSPFSVCGWLQSFKVGSLSLMGKSDAVNAEWLVFYQSNVIYFRLYDMSPTLKYLGRTAPFVGATQNGRLNHIACTYSGNSSSTGMKIYINGVQSDNANSSSGVYVAMENSTAPLRIGRVEGVANTVGFVDFARVYNRELSSNEILSLYTAQKPYFL